MADQTGKIREATARGLEPELRRLVIASRILRSFLLLCGKI